jgi:hypothetical protein
MSYLKDREIWLSSVPTGNPPAGYVWVFIQNGVFVVRDSNGLDKIMATTTGTVTNATSASYVEYSNVASKPALISGSSQVSYTGLSNIPVGIVSGSSQVTYSGLTGIPSGIVSGSAQIASFGIFATTGSNGFNGSQSITGSLTVTGQVVAQTLNVQQVTSSIVYSSGSNIFGNSLGNTQQFTGSVGVTGSLTVAGAGTFSNSVTSTIFDSTSNAFRLNGNNALSLVTLSEQNVVKINAAGYWGSQIVGANDQGILVTNVGNVGIGTTSPQSDVRLHIQSSASGGQNLRIQTSIAAGRNYVQWANGSGDMGYLGYGGADSKFYIVNQLNDDMIISTNNTERMRITSAGNFDYGGFNVQSSNNSTYRQAFYGNLSIMWRNGGDAYVNSNHTYSSSNTNVATYGTDSGIGRLSLVGGEFNWATFNGSVTAGSAYALTDRFFINKAGNVGVGTVTPGTNLHVEGPTVSYGQVRILSTSNSVGEASIHFGRTNQTLEQRWTVGQGVASIGDSFGFYTGGSPRMVLTTGGQVLFGTTSGTGITTGTSANQGVGIGGGVLEIQTNNNSNIYLSKATGYTSGDFTAHFVNGGYVGGISTNGSATNYATASDYRLKQDLKDFDGITLINKIKTYDYEWKVDNTRMFGVIAHELQEILPFAVTGEKDAERMQGVDYSKLIPVLVKSIQEQQTLIESLKSRIEILEQ